MKTLKMAAGDLAREENINRWIIIDGGDAVIQRLNNRLKLFLGEWFLNTSLGMDWINLFEKPFSLAYVKSEIYREIMEDEAVTAINTLDIVPDYGNRKLYVELEVEADGETIQLTKEIE